jgi:hypothetical protein
MNLWAQLACSAGLLVLMATLHALGVVGVTRLLKLDAKALRAHEVDLSAFGLMIAMALSLFALHLVEILIFALFYMGVGAIGALEPALYFSASTYTTIGHPGPEFPIEWRLVGAIEGLVGFLLIGWSTGVFIADMNQLLRD